MLSRLTLCCTLVPLIPVAQAATAQQQRDNQLGFHAPTSDRTASHADEPSSVALGIKPVGLGVSGALAGVGVGLVVDDIYCQQHHGHEQGFIFGPCAFYAGYGAAIGWFGGAAIAATAEAVHLARKRGCPRKSGITRALAGAVPGLIPG